MPDPTPADVLKTLQAGLDIKITASGQLPGEAIIVALIGYAGKVRDSMAPPLQARLDAVLVQQVEDSQHVWRGIWKALGLVS